VVTIALPTLTPSSATLPAAAANLDCPTHNRQNLHHFASLAVCCSRPLLAQLVPQGGFACLSKVCCSLCFLLDPWGWSLTQRKEQSWLSTPDVQLLSSQGGQHLASSRSGK